MTDKLFTRRELIRTIGTGTALAGVTAGTASGVHLTWNAHLRPMIDESRGQGNFELKRVQQHMEFGLQAANLTSSVKMAHIHHRADGAPVVWLFSDVPFHPGDSTDRSIQRGDGAAFVAGGSFTSNDLVGHLSGGSLDDLVSAIESGDTFVRVHTADNLGGEIQGDLG